MPDQGILDLLHGTFKDEPPADAGEGVRAAKAVSEATGVPVRPVYETVLGPMAVVPHTSSAGPATSQDAGDQHTDSGKRQTNAMRVLRLVRDAPVAPTATQLHGAGQTIESIEHGPQPKLHLQEIRRRLTDLQALNYVEKGERRGGEYTWQLTPDGKAIAEMAEQVARGRG